MATTFFILGSHPQRRDMAVIDLVHLGVLLLLLCLDLSDVLP